MESPTSLNPVQEEYLAAVLLLQQKKVRVAIAALARHFHSHFSFARAAVDGLVNIGLLEMSAHNGVRLTLEGGIRARDIDRRRTAMAHVLSDSLHLDRMTADEAARNLRRALSRAHVNRIMASRRRHHQADLEGDPGRAS